MKYKANTRRKAIEYEKDLVRYWKDNKTFEKSVEQRPKEGAYVFYDGPPFITGVPHHGTLLSSIVKDAVPRYWTMKGRRVERVWGWDCHGLPAEVFTEKKLGIQDRRDIGTKISLEQYITTCRDNMVQTGNLWEDTIDRIGRWVDMKHAYKTMDKEFMESVWWAFKKLYEEGKIYEGEKVLLYCTRDATPISKAEVAMDNSYQDVTDPSVYVKFKLQDVIPSKAEESSAGKKGDLSTVPATAGSAQDDKTGVYLLAWTTTPWTLPANTAVAVNENEEYAEVEVDGEVLILAKSLLEKALTNEKHNVVPHTIKRKLKGKELVGRSYEPLFEDRGKNAHKIWHADYVSMEEGTGIVHLAPAYGEEDYALSREKGFPFINNIDDNGLYKEGEWQGQNVWEANKPIAKALHERGVVWKIDYIRHSYPHCHRCGTKLMYRAHPSWFMDIAGQRDVMLEQNENINWFPGHVKHGRFAKTVESAPDWNLSRDRFWATAMPVWKGVDKDGNEKVKVVGSYEELKTLSGVELEDYHRPWIDDVEFDLDGVHYTRIDKVMDCWFESGSMPFAQFHYPFENKEKFEASFPGDFIAEYVGQVRAWFYYLHAVSVGLFGENSFKNCIVTGTLAGNDGRKMSKSYGNYTDPNVLMDEYSADALRFLLLNSPVLAGEDFNLIDKDVQDVQRKLAMVWNMYDFFTMYADVDEWEWDGSLELNLKELHNPLDRWVVSRLHQMQEQMVQDMDAYNLPDALSGVLPFLDDASNWYVRRSRRRFWKSEDDTDKNEAYRTLHYVLVRLSMLLAPFTPFLAEELYRNLTGGESVHLLDWPAKGEVDDVVLKDMAHVRTVIEQGLAARMHKSEQEAQVKVRQPLARLTYGGDKLDEYYESIIADEVNVKEVQHVDEVKMSVTVDKKITPELQREGMMREVVRAVQNARKQAGLNVDDRILLYFVTEDPVLKQAIEEHEAIIQNETLTQERVEPGEGAFYTETKIDGSDLAIALRKA
jgi:isoleucyl-tRNA synthetase